MQDQQLECTRVRGRVLVIAGSDCSGGAGLEADQKVLASHGCYAMTATTALTAQNTKDVVDIHHIPPEFVRKQIDAVVEDIGVDVTKIGMLGSAAMIEMVAKAIVDHKLEKLVLDPVMVATTGAQLLAPEAIKDLRDLLLPHAYMLTPNIPEARLLLAATTEGENSFEIKCIADLEKMAIQLASLGASWVLVKGGHVPFREDGTVARTPEERKLVVNVLYGEEIGFAFRISSPYQASSNTHGTGCSLASAIAANLAKGSDPTRAVQAACRYVETGIQTAPGFGHGNGPLNHFHSLQVLPFAPGCFVQYLLSRPDVAPVWHRFVYHPFVMAIGSGKLPLESFKGYLIQDYLYLVQYARAHALAGYKSDKMEDIVTSAAIISHINTEMSLHLEYCANFGITRPMIEAASEHPACMAYTRYVLDMGHASDWLALQVAMAPCLLGYAAVARQLFGDPNTLRGDVDKEDGVKVRESNRYWKWIHNYVAEDYAAAVRKGERLLEQHVLSVGPRRVEELVKVFVTATEMEIKFWEMFPSE